LLGHLLAYRGWRISRIWQLVHPRGRRHAGRVPLPVLWSYRVRRVSDRLDTTARETEAR
jgi:hypothetical protein